MKRGVLFLLLCGVSSLGFGMEVGFMGAGASKARDEVVYPDCSDLWAKFNLPSPDLGMTVDSGEDSPSAPAYVYIKWPGYAELIKEIDRGEFAENGKPRLELFVRVPKKCLVNEHHRKNLIDCVNYWVDSRSSEKHVAVCLVCGCTNENFPEAEFDTYSFDIKNDSSWKSFEGGLRECAVKINNVWEMYFEVKSDPFAFDVGLTRHANGRVVFSVSPDYGPDENYEHFLYTEEEQALALQSLGSSMNRCVNIVFTWLGGVERKPEIEFILNTFEKNFDLKFLPCIIFPLENITRIHWCGTSREILSRAVCFFPKRLSRLLIGEGIKRDGCLLRALKVGNFNSIELLECEYSYLEDHR